MDTDISQVAQYFSLRGYLAQKAKEDNAARPGTNSQPAIFENPKEQLA